VPAPAARGRARRSVSPSKIATPHKKLASPRKRNSKAVNASNAANDADAHAASTTLQEALNKAASAAFQPLHRGEEGHPSDGEKVKVEVDSTVEVNGDVETKHSTVKVEFPSDSPNVPLPESASDMIAKAKEMVEEARKHEADVSAKKTNKRKADEVEGDNEGSDVPKLKKTKGLEEALRKEKAKTKALIGLSATLAIGYV
jgi:hypothetical protein